MRLDLFLKKVGIIKRRTIAKALIEKGTVSIVDRSIKPSMSVYIGMKIKIGEKIYEIIAIPEKMIRNNEGDKYYRVIDDWDYSG